MRNWWYSLLELSKGLFILRRNCVALSHCTLLHRNCDVTVLRSRMKVEFILTWNAVMLRWLAAESNLYISTAMQLRCSMNGPYELWSNSDRSLISLLIGCSFQYLVSSVYQTDCKSLIQSTSVKLSFNAPHGFTNATKILVVISQMLF